MHLNKLIEQIKQHPQVVEELLNGNMLDKCFDMLKTNVYEAVNGPHFDEDAAREAVLGMRNEDGTRGPHWTVEETTAIANQLGMNLKTGKHNKWDWFVAMNMIYSDYCKAVVALTGNAHTKYFAELAKAWICDKDISEGKMWHYYVYLMCDDVDDLEIGRYAKRYRRYDDYDDYEVRKEYEPENRRSKYTSVKYF